MKKRTVNIVKASGRTVPFSKLKFSQSLQRAGAEKKLAMSIAEDVSRNIYEGMSTREVYKIGFDRLRRQAGHIAARYSLKRAIMQLGPSGFPFEKFIGEIMKAMGYTVQVGVTVKGKCVNHEIDIVAEKDNNHFMIECKYHNLPGTICSVKIPLYIQARFLDVHSTWVQLPGHAKKFHQGWVVTNTRFTGDAIEYGTCAGLYLLGWDYPKKGSLRELIDTYGLHPVTCLTTLTKHEKYELLQNNVVLCKEICGNVNELSRIGVKSSRFASIQEEGRKLCANQGGNGTH